MLILAYDADQSEYYTPLIYEVNQAQGTGEGVH
jgi:hypothetical protein